MLKTFFKLLPGHDHLASITPDQRAISAKPFRKPILRMSASSKQLLNDTDVEAREEMLVEGGEVPESTGDYPENLLALAGVDLEEALF